jgi:hypothetical protein
MAFLWGDRQRSRSPAEVLLSAASSSASSIAMSKPRLWERCRLRVSQGAPMGGCADTGVPCGVLDVCTGAKPFCAWEVLRVWARCAWISMR